MSNPRAKLMITEGQYQPYFINLMFGSVILFKLIFFCKIYLQSRAILCNDSLIKKLEELEQTEIMYKSLVDHTRRVLRGYFDLLMICKGKLYKHL